MFPHRPECNDRLQCSIFFPTKSVTFHSLKLRLARTHLIEISKFQERRSLINYLKSADSAQPECFFYTTGRLTGAKKGKEFIRRSTLLDTLSKQIILCLVIKCLITTVIIFTYNTIPLFVVKNPYTNYNGRRRCCRLISVIEALSLIKNINYIDT